MLRKLREKWFSDKKNVYIKNAFQKQPYRGVLKKRCTGEHPCRIMISIKLQSKATLLKSHFGMGVLLWICGIFSGTPFLKNISGWLLLHVEKYENIEANQVEAKKWQQRYYLENNLHWTHIIQEETVYTIWQNLGTIIRPYIFVIIFSFFWIERYI